MSTTSYFRFPTEAAFRALLPEGFVQQGETGFPLPAGMQAMRIVGVLRDSEASGASCLPGFHVNVLGELPDAWKPYQVFPSSPQGVFG